mmetsp:Transcript_24211/g.40620  ORF Transcript_24211/g.40620 Transcript_24211/m.40620 type:complete len:215 (-) Transcript_24211:133-777(-)
MTQPELQMLPICFATEAVLAVIGVGGEGAEGAVADELVFGVRGLRAGKVAAPQEVLLSSLCDDPVPVHHRRLCHLHLHSRVVKLDEEGVFRKDFEDGAGRPVGFVGEQGAWEVRSALLGSSGLQPRHVRDLLASSVRSLSRDDSDRHVEETRGKVLEEDVPGEVGDEARVEGETEGEDDDTTVSAAAFLLVLELTKVDISQELESLIISSCSFF